MLQQRLIEEINKSLNVVKATNRARLYEELEDLQKRYNVHVQSTI